MGKRYWPILIIILLAFIIRFWGITSSPNGLAIDEASIGYNAWSIITTGKDEHGANFPLFFKAFGEYKLPVFIYSVALTQLLLGPTDLSVRLPAVLFGIGTIICFYLFLKIFLLEFFNQKLSHLGAYLGAFLMAISPWHIQFTRTGFEASSALFFLTLGVYLFFRGKKSGSLKLLIFSILSFVLTLYSYNSARIVTPVLTLSLAILYFRSYKLNYWITAFLIGISTAAPFLLFSSSPEGLARAREVVILYYPNSQNPILEIVLNYWKNISPYYLFYYGDPTLSHTTAHRMSLLYLIELPFFYLGLIFLVFKVRKSALTSDPARRQSLFILIWFLIGAVPAAITILNPHALRGFLVLPALILVSVIGFLNFLNFFKTEPVKKILTSIYVLCLLYLCLNFLSIYHNLYIRDSGWDWLSDIKQVSREVNLLKNDYDKIYFEEGGPRIIAYLWHLKYLPGNYQKLSDKKIAGDYYFESTYQKTDEIKNDLLISRSSDLPEELIEVISYPNGTPAFYLYRSGLKIP